MKVEVLRNSIRISASDDQDRAFIEDTLCLKDVGDAVKLKRVKPQGPSTGYVRSTDPQIIELETVAPK